MFIQRGPWLGFPLGHCHRADPFIRCRERPGDTKARIGLQVLKQARQHGGVAVGGFDEHLRLSLARRNLLPRFELPRALGGVDWRIAVKGEALPVQAAGHQPEQDRRGADPGANGRPPGVGDRDRTRAGIGDGRATGL